jgi:hypothetical protein
MKRIFYAVIFLAAAIGLNSCQKTSTSVQPPFDSEFSQPYTTGVIKFQYKVPTYNVKLSTMVDTTVNFTATGFDPVDVIESGYWDPSVPWFYMIRRNTPYDTYLSATIYFMSTDFDTLTLPYTFKAGNREMANLEYRLGIKTAFDRLGNPVYLDDVYLGQSAEGDFTLTLISKTNNRVQGTFSGTATNTLRDPINISQGIFDIQIGVK